MNFGIKHTWVSHFRCVPVKCVTLDKLLNLSDLQLCHLKIKEEKQIIESGCKNKETNACAGLCTDLASKCYLSSFIIVIKALSDFKRNMST